MDERTPAPGESPSSPTTIPGESPGCGSGRESYSSQGAWSSSGLTPHGRENVRRMGSAARRRLISEADSRRTSVADRIDRLAGSLENNPSSGPEGRFLNATARVARNASSTIRNRSSEELLDDLEQGFRNRPGAFLAGCLALGFIGGRLFRS